LHLNSGYTITGKYVKNPAKITGFQSLSRMALGQGGDLGHSQII
jgi:hypothetical protein